MTDQARAGRPFCYGSWVLWAPILILGSGLAMAATPGEDGIGETVIVVSEVRGVIGETTRELAVQDDVFSEEVIETEEEAATRIVFRDGTELSMGPSSRMVLDRYVYDPDAGIGQMVMRLVTGVFQFASGEMEPEGYDIQTPFGNLAVRGTVCTLDIIEGERAVLSCSELDTVSFAGQLLSDAGDCLVVPVPGTGDPFSLSAEECADELQRAALMLALLGDVADVEPAAGPRGIDGRGPDEDPVFAAPLGTSPQ